ncbi:MAG: SUMF1/EgtB/PvdO family nonheme iron enzyme [Deltaproteobacteria bacterium]|nr:SUMF1/EgtB/PvdO family nonheme iron enzyme [Deltaproteobacteria bacterium]
MPPAAGTIGERYEILEEEGSTPFARVVRALDREVEVEVTAWLVGENLLPRAEDRAAFCEDALRMRAVSHANLRRFFDAGQESAQCHVTLQRIDGETLGERIRKSRRVHDGLIAIIARAMADGLGAAEDEGLVHGWLRPDDVTMAGELLKLSGVGLWRSLNRDAARAAFHKDLRYVAAEVVRGDRATARSDVYSIAFMLTELALGRPARPEESAERMVLRLYDERARLARVLEEALSALPESRPASARLLGDQIEEVLGERPSRSSERSGGASHENHGASPRNPDVEVTRRVDVFSIPDAEVTRKVEISALPDQERTRRVDILAAMPVGGVVPGLTKGPLVSISAAATQEHAGPTTTASEASTEHPRTAPVEDPPAIRLAEPHRVHEAARIALSPPAQGASRRSVALLGGALVSLLALAAAGLAVVRSSAFEPSPSSTLPGQASAVSIGSAPEGPVRSGVPSMPSASPPVAAKAPSDSVVVSLKGTCPEKARLVPGSPRFCIDMFEAPGQGHLPLANVTLDEAREACSKAQKRLCTEEEWERACRGEEGASYPYGHAYKPNQCNAGAGHVARAGAFPECKSRLEVYDMVGNVAEWVEEGTVRGGAVGDEDGARCSRLRKRRPNAPSRRVGFRCCSEATRPSLP